MEGGRERERERERQIRDIYADRDAKLFFLFCHINWLCVQQLLVTNLQNVLIGQFGFKKMLCIMVIGIQKHVIVTVDTAVLSSLSSNIEVRVCVVALLLSIACIDHWCN